MTTYSELISQISKLQKQAVKQRKEEYSSVVRSIKKQIAEFGISAAELGFKSPDGTSKLKDGRKATKTSRRKRAGSVGKVPPKYRDNSGNSWTGRGKTPLWVSAYLTNGGSLEELRISHDAE